MKEIGRCDQCSISGVLRTIEVVPTGTPGPVVRLRLCTRCATVPSSTWRRRYEPAPGVGAYRQA
jgi:hypothetical protein